MDPRTELIGKRLEKIGSLVPVASGKGGVGKSLIASTASLIASKRGCRVGLLDLDLHGPSAHLILGADSLEFPEEEKGVLPPDVNGVKFMSSVYYSRDKPSPLRGEDISDVIREILSITKWGELDFLFIDMPPGSGDEILETIQLIQGSEFLVVTTPSKVALSAVEKLVQMLQEVGVPITGVVENMKTENSPDIRKDFEELGVRYLGGVPLDREVERVIGKPEEILRTDFARGLKKIFKEVEKLPGT